MLFGCPFQEQNGDYERFHGSYIDRRLPPPLACFGRVTGESERKWEGKNSFPHFAGKYSGACRLGHSSQPIVRGYFVAVSEETSAPSMVENALI